MQQKSLVYSIALHIILILLVGFGIPILSFKKELQEQVIVVDLLPVMSQTNVKPSSNDKPKKEEPKKEEPKPKEEPQNEALKDIPKAAEEPEQQKTPDKPLPPEPEPVKEMPKEPLPEVKKEEPQKEPEPKPKEEEKPKPKEKKPEEEFDPDNLLKTLEKSAKKSEKKQPQKKNQESTPDDFAEDIEKSLNKSKNAEYDATKPLSISEIDAIRQQISKCWSPPIGAKDAGEMVVSLRINIDPDGTVTKVGMVNGGKYNSDPFYKAAADAARRAVLNPRCNPLKNLPTDKYERWKEIELNFDPREMLY